MSDLDTVLDSGRVAHASIQGYLYQAYLGVERWLELPDNLVLRCEGDEDIDQLLRHGSGGLSEQVKVLSRGVTTEVAQKTLRQFAVSHYLLRTATPPDLRRFLFTSTANSSVNLVKDWEGAKKDETESLAWLLEAAGGVALERCGAILEERVGVTAADGGLPHPARG